MTFVAGVASSLVPFGCEATQHSSNYQFVVVVVVVVTVVTKAAFSSVIAPVPFVGHTGLSITTRRPFTALQLSGRPLITFQDHIFILSRVGLVLRVCGWACFFYWV